VEQAPHSIPTTGKQKQGAMRTIWFAFWAAALALTLELGFGQDNEINEDTRQFGLDVTFIRCDDLALPMKTIEELNERVQPIVPSPYGRIFFKDALIDSGRRYFRDRTSLSWNGTFHGSVRYVELDGSMLSTHIYTFDYIEDTLRSIGWVNLTLPSSFDGDAWTESKFGTERKDSEPYTVDVIDSKDGKKYGTCQFTIRLYAKKCLPGEYLTFGDSSSCFTCTEGSFCPNGYGAVSCYTNTFADTGASKCTSCPLGTVAESGSSSCTDCAAGMYRSGAETNCQKCDAGSYGSGKDEFSTCAGPCDAGYFCRSGSTSRNEKECPPGSWSAEGSSSCEKCAAGFFGTGAGTNEGCDGKCAAGYRCPVGSSSSMQLPCTQDDPEYFCPEGSSEAVPVSSGHYTFGSSGSEGTREAQAPCPAGFMCENGFKVPCPEGTYQDETGQFVCKTCPLCGDDSYRADCGGTSLGECQQCAITRENVDELCTQNSLFFPCDGTSLEDIAVCIDCSNRTATNGDSVQIGTNITLMFNSTEEEEAYFENCVSGALSNGPTVNVQKGLPPWVIGVAVSGFALVFGVVLLFIVKKRKAMRRRMEELDQQNKSFENDRDLAFSMNLNMNPMLTNVHPDRTRSRLDAEDAVAIVGQDEFDELSKHKRALEDEVRRLKKEKQQDEAARIENKPSSKLQAKKREFSPQ